MSKQHRTKLIKQLEAEMEATTDPQLKLDLAKQITKLMPRPKQRKVKAKEEAPSGNQTSPIVAKWADRLSHLPEQERIMESIILECEERGRSRGIGFDPPSIESRALLAEVMGMLSAEERTVLNSGSPEVA